MNSWTGKGKRRTRLWASDGFNGWVRGRGQGRGTVWVLGQGLGLDGGLGPGTGRRIGMEMDILGVFKSLGGAQRSKFHNSNLGFI